MSNNESAFMYYSKNMGKKVPNKKAKQSPKVRTNGAGKIAKNGVKIAKLKPTFKTAAIKSIKQIKRKKENLQILNGVDKIAAKEPKNIATMPKKGGLQHLDSDPSDLSDDGSENSCDDACDNSSYDDDDDYEDDDSDAGCNSCCEHMSEIDDDASCDSDADSNSNTDELDTIGISNGSEYYSTDDEDNNCSELNSTNQYSEYTLNSDNPDSSATESETESAPIAELPPPTPSLPPIRTTAPKRHSPPDGIVSYTFDLNNNDGDQPIIKSRKSDEPTGLLTPSNLAANVVALALKSCSLPSKRSPRSSISCKLSERPSKPSISSPLPKERPSKSSISCKLTERPVKSPISCPLPSKSANKMADNMAVKSCALPKDKKNDKQQEQANDRRSQTSVNKKSTEMIEKNKQSPKKSCNPANDQSLPTVKAVHLNNSIDEGKRILYWLLHPVTPENFFTKYWEQNACQVQRKRKDYFSQLISFKMIDEMLIRNHLEFTTNIDLTSYKDGIRETHNPVGRAMPPTVWGHYAEGCSVRILNPSTYLSGLRQVCSILQEYFHCLVGANVYLTPPNSQGFAPHYDDIEAFVLQIEGRKRWRLYPPPKKTDALARTSSGNYKQAQIGEPTLDIVLHPGDILYFPRGTVHQAVTEENYHSLHITLSVYQQQAYANLLEKLMPAVLENAIKQNLNLRRGLPLHTWHHLGVAHGGQKSEKRKRLITDVQRLAQHYLVPSDTQIDAAVDQLAKNFQHEALPPTILADEHVRTVFGSRSNTDAQGQCHSDYEMRDDTSVRLLRANILRLVVEGNSIRIYFYVDNALEYCKYEANFMEIQSTEAPVVEKLIAAYPKYLKISEFPIRNKDRRIDVATALWERGLLMTEKPFKK